MKLGIFARTFDRATIHETLAAVAAARVRATQFNMSVAGLETIPAQTPESTIDAIAAAAGAGILPWATIVRGLHNAGYEGSLVIHGLAEQDIPVAVATLEHAGEEVELLCPVNNLDLLASGRGNCSGWIALR